MDGIEALILPHKVSGAGRGKQSRRRWGGGGQGGGSQCVLMSNEKNIIESTSVPFHNYLRNAPVLIRDHPNQTDG